MPDARIVPIIGGGPAGMSCALWLHNFGFRPIIIERAPDLGGLARSNPYRNDWLLGRPGATGRQNAEEFARHIRDIKIETWLRAVPRNIRRAADNRFALEVAFCQDGRAPQSLSSAAIVIATGTRFRGEEWLGRVANARRLAAAGRVHLGPIAAGEPGADLGTHVALVGGGDNAFDVARMLVERGVRTAVLMRAQAPRAQPLLVERLRDHQSSGMAEVLAATTVEALELAGARIGIRLSGGAERTVDHVLLLLGYQPNTDDPWLAELPLARDAHGYLVVDGSRETTCHGVFAIGDVADPRNPCIATALATGTIAAREIQKRLATS